MSNQVATLTRNQMENMVAQANSILQMYDKITELKMEMADMNSEFRKLYEEIKKEFEDFKNTVPLTGPQADRLYAVCTRKGHQLTKQYFGEEVSQELYSKKFGHLVKGVYTAIRKKFEVNKYNQVKRVECEVAIAFTETLTLSDLPKNYLRLTDHQIDTAKRHGDFEILKRLG